MYVYRYNESSCNFLEGKKANNKSALRCGMVPCNLSREDIEKNFVIGIINNDSCLSQKGRNRKKCLAVSMCLPVHTLSISVTSLCTTMFNS